MPLTLKGSEDTGLLLWCPRMQVLKTLMGEAERKKGQHRCSLRTTHSLVNTYSMPLQTSEVICLEQGAAEAGNPTRAGGDTEGKEQIT